MFIDSGIVADVGIRWLAKPAVVMIHQQIANNRRSQ